MGDGGSSEPQPLSLRLPALSLPRARRGLQVQHDLLPRSVKGRYPVIEHVTAGFSSDPVAPQPPSNQYAQKAVAAAQKQGQGRGRPG